MNKNVDNFLIYYIVGLPASGKTTFMCNYFDTKEYCLIDDINTPDRLPDNLKKPIVITDPHAVYISNYEMSIKYLLNRYQINKENILTINFENKPKLCLLNAKKRNDKNVNNFIIKSSKQYNTDNYLTNKIVPVFGQLKKNKLNNNNFNL